MACCLSSLEIFNYSKEIYVHLIASQADCRIDMKDWPVTLMGSSTYSVIKQDRHL